MCVGYGTSDRPGTRVILAVTESVPGFRWWLLIVSPVINAAGQPVILLMLLLKKRWPTMFWWTLGVSALYLFEIPLIAYDAAASIDRAHQVLEAFAPGSATT